MQRKTQRAILATVIIAVAIGVTALMVMQKPVPQTKPLPSLALLVETIELQAATTTFTVSSQGTVLPRTETLLSSEVSGTIDRISPKFVAGGVFDAGEELLRIDPTNYRVAVEQAEALVRQRQIEYDGASKLRSQGYRAEADYASAAAALASAKAELTRASRNLERTSIRLPYRGMVRVKSADLGQFVSPGTRLGTTFAVDTAEIRLPLTDRDIGFVDLPQPGEYGDQSGPAVTLSATRKGRVFQWPARIVRTEGVVDLESRVTYAVAQVEDPYQLDGDGEPLPIGTFVSAAVKGITAEDILRVPRAALRQSNQLMFVDDESRLQLRTVEISTTDSDYAYISGGAQSGERVIVTALESPINGTPVRTSADEEADTLATRQAADSVE